MKTQFELINGRIFLIVSKITLNDEVVILEEDVTDNAMPVVDEYLDYRLGLTDYKHSNGRIGYIGKGRYY